MRISHANRTHRMGIPHTFRTHRMRIPHAFRTHRTHAARSPSQRKLSPQPATRTRNPHRNPPQPRPTNEVEGHLAVAKQAVKDAAKEIKEAERAVLDAKSYHEGCAKAVGFLEEELVKAKARDTAAPPAAKTPAAAAASAMPDFVADAKAMGLKGAEVGSYVSAEKARWEAAQKK